MDVLVVAHLLACAGLCLFGLHRVWLLVELWGVTRRSPAIDDTDVAATADARHPPRVTVQLPLYNERAVADRLIRAVCAMRWPSDRFEVQVLDDSTDDTVDVVAASVARARAAGLDVVHVRRPTRDGYKAGALAYGLERAKGELIAIFDADFVPDVDFLERMVPAFGDPEIGMVQARWGHLNRDASLLSQAQSVFLDAHFSVEHRVRAARHRFFNFNGTAGVWRRRAIVEAGGWDATTLTEDLDLSFRAQLAGSRFAYLDDVEVKAELPLDFGAFKGQQHRWAKGSIETARRLLPAVLRAKIPLGVKVDATLKLTQNLAFFLLALVVATMPFAGLHRALDAPASVRAFDLVTLGLATMPVAVEFFIAQMLRGQPIWKTLARLPLALGLGAGLAVNNARAVFAGLFSRGQDEFVRTPKRGDGPRPTYVTALDAIAVAEVALGSLHLTVAALLVWHGSAWASPFLWWFGTALVLFGGGSIVEAVSMPSRRASVATKTA